MTPELAPNRPTPEGRLLGAQLARLSAGPIARRVARHGAKAEPCRSCAFRPGTVPNGCPETLISAMESMLSGEIFYCHEGQEDGEPTRACRGWAAVAVVDPLDRRTAGAGD